MTNVAVTVNGQRHEADVEPRQLLVYFLRETLGLKGTNVGCDTTSCGACTVLVDGESVKSCTVFAVQADGSEVTTIEGLASDGAAAPGAAGVPRAARTAVRLLHAGIRHGDGLAARGEPEPVRGGDPSRARGQPLPLHRLPQHRAARSRRRQGRAHDPRGLLVRAGRVRSRRRSSSSDATDAKVLAGGHSLIPAHEASVRTPVRCSSTSAGSTISRYVREDGDRIAIGALTRHAELVRDPVLAAGLRADRAARPSSSATRRFAIGARSAARSHTAIRRPIATLSCLRSTRSWSRTGPDGERTIPATAFFLGPLRRPRSGRRSCSPGYASRSSSEASTSVPAIGSRLGDRSASRRSRGQRPRQVALASMGPTSLRAECGRRSAGGRCVRSRRCRSSVQGTEPPTDVSASSEYRATSHGYSCGARSSSSP